MTTLSSALVGTTVRLVGTFRDVTGALADPTTVTLKVKRPDATTETFATASLIRTSTGVFTRDYQLTQAGTYTVHFESTGNPTVVEEAAIDVRAVAVS